MRPRLGAIAVALGLAACGGDSTGPPVVYVRVIPQSTIVFAGFQRQFAAIGVRSDGDSVALPATFTATGGTISSTGLYTAGPTPGTYFVAAAAQGFADTAAVTINPVPPPGSYTTVIGDDWLSYATSADLAAANLFYVGDNRFILDSNIAIVPDPIFQQVARITQPQDPSTNPPGMTGWTPRHSAGFTALDQVWYRFRVRWSPGWTTVGPYPVGSANSYKLAFIQWVPGFSHRAEIEFSNTSQYLPGYGFTGISCTTTLVSGSTSWGNVTTEWSGGEWWEFIMYYQKTGATSARGRFWRRQLTSGGVVVNNSFTMIGEDKTNCSSATPQASGIALGANKNKTTPATQYIYWGPYEVVDGSQYPDPWGVGP